MTEKSQSVGANVNAIEPPAESGRLIWITPSLTAIEVFETETGGSNYLNPDGGGNCAS